MEITKKKGGKKFKNLGEKKTVFLLNWIFYRCRCLVHSCTSPIVNIFIHLIIHYSLLIIFRSPLCSFAFFAVKALKSI